jgi:hypothetical protein
MTCPATHSHKHNTFFLFSLRSPSQLGTIFRRNRIQWHSIEEEVKEWTYSSWKRWEVEKPAWLTARHKMSIPPEFLEPEGTLGGKGVESMATSVSEAVFG